MFKLKKNYWDLIRINLNSVFVNLNCQIQLSIQNVKFNSDCILKKIIQLELRFIARIDSSGSASYRYKKRDLER
jgi:hypothetical protein